MSKFKRYFDKKTVRENTFLTDNRIERSSKLLRLPERFNFFYLTLKEM